MHQNQGSSLQMIKKIENYIFNLNQKIGQGSFSQVYKGTDITHNTTVAVKKIRVGDIKSKIARRLLDCEISILKIVNHPSIIKCLDVHTSINNCYIITELCQGGDLDQLLHRHRKFTEDQILKIIHSVYRALQYLSNLGIVHRDLKVSNIFLHQGNYKLGDFGFAICAKQLFKDITVGSPVYMSPQGLINNTYGPKTDVWSFGLLIYELLNGTIPLASCKSEDQLKRKVLQPPQITKQISSDLKQLMINCLKINEKERYTVKQIGLSHFMKRVCREIQGQMEIEKDLTMTVFSTSTSISQKVALFFPQISYENAVSLIHYCRLLNKTIKVSPSNIFSKCLLWVSFNLMRSNITMQDTSQQKQVNLRDIIKEYNDKYIAEYGLIMPNTIHFQDILPQCDRKLQQQPKMSANLKLLYRESELLVKCLESGCMQQFCKKSKSKQYTTNIGLRE